MKYTLSRHLFAPLSVFLSSLFATQTFAQASDPIAIIGGQGNVPYAAFVEQDGSVVTIPGLPPTGHIFRVAMNQSNEGLIGGTSGLDAYAAFATPNGTLTPITGLMVPGEIYTVAINQSGAGIIGGGGYLANVPYAALVAPDGSKIELTDVPASGLIYGVAIDDSGVGIIGGSGPSSSAYAALVSPAGVLTPLVGLPSTGGIFWTASNPSGQKFIGGYDTATIYAAFVNPTGSVTPVSGFPLGQAYAVRLNALGNGIVGGKSLDLPYAAFVSSAGEVTTIKGLPSTTGIIYNVALNDSGTGLIAGFSTTGPYGAFVDPEGVLTPLVGLPSGTGFLDGIALDNSGIALVGGSSSDVPYLAVAAPNGALTYFSGLPAEGEINSIASHVFEQLIPKNINLLDSWVNTQFTFTNVLNQHCLDQQRSRYQAFCECCCDSECEKVSTFWIAPFGSYIREKAHHERPDFSNKIAGVLAGYDYKGISDVVLGGAIGYAFNKTHYRQDLGNNSINQESLVVYASLNKPCFYANLALWGGAFQASNQRRTFNSITSKSSPYGWNLCPHLELSTPIALTSCQRYVIDPFVTLDWANNWQQHFKERGASGLNLTLRDLHISVLRSEIGLRLFETFHYGWGRLVLEQKGSYVNRITTNRGRGRVRFVGAGSAFNVKTITPYERNLGVVQVHLECVPASLSDVYASIDYQGEFGASFQSNALTLEIGKNF